MQAATQAARAIAERTGVARHDVAVVLGSGWAPAVRELGDPVAVLPVAELPGFTPPTAEGHGGQVLSVPIGGHRVLVFVGQPVLISDHLNLTGRSPLVGPRFVDMVDAYTPRLRALAREIDPTLAEGVYAGLPGPQYETPAEIRMLRTLGADLVGMSTVHETIAAREAGAAVLGVSLVTNLAAGMTGAPLNHEEVLEAGRQSATRMGSLLASVIARL